MAGNAWAFAQGSPPDFARGSPLDDFNQLQAALDAIPCWPGRVPPFEKLLHDVRHCADDIISNYRRIAQHKDTPNSRGLSKSLWIQALLPLAIFVKDPDDAEHEDSLRFWDTDKIRNVLMQKKPPQVKHIGLAVGTLTQDLPPSSNARRHDGDRSKPWAPRPERRKGQQAYLKPCFKADANQLTWFWSDPFGKGIDERLVKLDSIGGTQLTLAQAQAAAICYHDQVVLSWLWNVTAVCIRERIIRRGHADMFPGCFEPEDDGPLPATEDFTVLKSQRPLRSEVLAHPQTSAELREVLGKENELELKTVVWKLRRLS